MDREAWRVAIHGVSKSRTRLSDWTELNWKGNLLQRGRMEMSRHLEQLGKVIHDITPYVQERTPLSLGTNVHPYLPGDLVWVKDWEQQMLSCSARRPYQDYKLRIMCSCPGPTHLRTLTVGFVGSCLCWWWMDFLGGCLPYTEGNLVPSAHSWNNNEKHFFL